MIAESSTNNWSEHCMHDWQVDVGGWEAWEEDLSISAISVSVQAVWEGLLGGRVLLGGPPRLGGKCAPTQLLPIFLQLLLRA